METRILWLDVETTGLDPNSDSIIQLAFITADNDEQNLYINTNTPISPGAYRVHNITKEKIQDCQPFCDIADWFLNIIQEHDIIGGYNVQFDIDFISAELQRCGLQMPDMGIIDVYKIWTNREKTHKLGDAYFRFTGKELQNAHDAIADIQATCEIFNQQKKLYSGDFIELSQDIPKKYFDSNNKILFGKYKGQIMDIHHIQYLNWLYQNGRQDDLKSEVLKQLKRLQ